MKRFLRWWIYWPSTPHLALLWLLWWFSSVLAMFCGDACLWAERPYC